ncbi:MAG: DUF3179 domain-containing protein [Armatimonadetes bacterium]|nr:DUF3179 domain-containing protein [Armatimonadota bacterium]
MKATIKPHTDWLWGVSGALFTLALVLAWVGRAAGILDETAPQVAAPVTVPAPAAVAEDPWRPIADKPLNGWLPASRYDPTPFFDVRKCLARPGEILDMPPGVDDIPAIDAPCYIPGDEVSWLGPLDEIIGISSGGEAHCLPLSVLVWHQLVNDTIDGRSVGIMYDPVSGAALGFSRKGNEESILFGISGKAWRGAALIYDRNERRLWHPITGLCVSGQGTETGARLLHVQVTRTTWAHWRRMHRKTLVLSRNTGLSRPYGLDPYAALAEDETLVPIADKSALRGIPPKTLVLGVRTGKVEVAFIPPASGDRREFRAAVGSLRPKITWDPRPGSRQFAASLPSSADSAQFTCYWFAWVAAYPNTQVFRIH